MPAADEKARGETEGKQNRAAHGEYLRALFRAANAGGLSHSALARYGRPILRTAVTVMLLAAAAGCAGNRTGEQVEQAVAAPADDAGTDVPANAAGDSHEPLLDRTQQTVQGIVVGAAQTIDNIFGSSDVQEEASVSRGQISVGGQWDQRDGAKRRFRFKGRFALPALEERASLLLGRGDANDLIDGSADENIDTLPGRFNDFQDEDWLLGVGYSRDRTLKRGWSFGAGVRIATPLEPFVRATYRWNRTFSDDWLWRVEPRVFVQSQRGAGVSLQNTLDHVINRSWLLRSWSIVLTEDDVQGVDWTTKLAAYQNLSRKSALAYGAYASGVTDNEVPITDYGVELRWRRQIAREWLFVEFLTFLNWPRELLTELRESNVGVGIEFEMQFGDWPGRPPQTTP